MTAPKPTIHRIDAASLPSGATDHRAPIWWGNVLLLAIETTMFMLLVAVYLYLVEFTSPWPPPKVQRLPVVWDTNPSLLISSINLLVIAAACIPAHLSDLAARRLDRVGVVRWQSVTFALALAAIVLRFLEFPGLHHRWDENAYGSITWTLLGMHLAHLMVVFVEGSFTVIWVAAKGIDGKHAMDVRNTVIYWYWVAGIWVLLYGLVYLGPRFF